MTQSTDTKPNTHTLLKVFASLCLLYSFSAGASAIPQVADTSSMQNCQYLNNVDGTSGYGKKSSWQSMAKDSALKQAKNLGASHVVWEKLYPVGAFNGVAVAKAFKCAR